MLPVAVIEIVRPAPIRTSAHGSKVSCALIVMSKVIT